MAQIIPIPAVNTAIFNENNEILLTRRSAQVREPGKWCLPGGHLEVGEFWLDGAVRETQEEIGITVKQAILCGLYSDPTLTVTQDPIQPEGYRGQFVVALFKVLSFEGDIHPNHEVDDWDWFDPNNLPEPILKSHPIRCLDAFHFNGTVFVR
ncbi:MAG: NUDIX hydrolase [Deltaproteobacteria bacterium]|nr:NUDIX hydrolase [Deltaproteobacteria bacterium]